ncbi:phosphate ABC transporter substrate-binding protein PstS [Persephonella atlantica]|uniref:Phosphate-binding protein n=1 Tax=Persephonella atlantica TaxID=2699429 RepID=A0ABS1GG18_9AQUI|nr:phosphate ABC transporter substrate-binding protein PstS [Persephonella atlantica]MBK3331820.1 phosphate ABC transporter substrate-binding protein PstS [Persephonella atlantica]
MKKILAGFVVAGVVSTSFAGDTINGAGATFPYPVYAAWAYKYYKETGIKLNYQSIGSGGGIRQIKNRTVDFGASDAPLNPEKLDEYKLYQFPAIIGGVVPVVNIPGVKAGKLRLDSDTLCHIFLGDIKYWDNEKIKKLNPEINLPHKDIKVVHRSDGSGTTAIFTTYLSQVCPDWKEKVGAGKAVKWPVGIGGKGNEGVANYVKRLKYSIGYVEFAYAKQNRLKYTLLKNQAGNFVAPSIETFKSAGATANFDPKKHFYLWMVNAPGKNAWPIAGASFILEAREKAEVNKKVNRFFKWAFEHGDEIAIRLDYVPLPKELKEKIYRYWEKYGINP